MKAEQIRKTCPVKIGQQYEGGTVIYIIGDSYENSFHFLAIGYDVWTKHEQVGVTSGLIKMPIYREKIHRITR